VPENLEPGDTVVSVIPGERAGGTSPVFQQPSPESAIPTGKFRPVDREDRTEADNPLAREKPKPSPEATQPTGKYQPVEPKDEPASARLGVVKKPPPSDEATTARTPPTGEDPTERIGAEDLASDQEDKTEVDFRAPTAIPRDEPTKNTLPEPASSNKLLRRLLGPEVRIVFGLFLVAAGALWLSENFSGAAADIVKADPKPLQASFVPAGLAEFFNHANPLVAGLLLVLSASFGSAIGVWCAVVGAFVVLVAPHLGMPALGPVKPYQSAMLLGIVIAATGLVFGRRKG
jgi:hypothetical protein